MNSKSIEKKEKYILIAVGIYQVACSVIGFINLISTDLGFNSLVFLFYLLATGLLIFSAYSGILLGFRTDKGLKLSIINQFIQFINFKFLGIGVEYYNGLTLRAGFEDTTPEIRFFFEFSSEFKTIIMLHIRDRINHENFLAFNIIPIILIIYLSNKYNRLKTNKP